MNRQKIILVCTLILWGFHFLSCEDKLPKICATDLSRAEPSSELGEYILLTGINVIPRDQPLEGQHWPYNFSESLTKEINFFIEMEYKKIHYSESPYPITEPKIKPINRIGFSRYFDAHHLSFNKEIQYFGENYQKTYEPNENIFQHFFSPENRNTLTGLYPPSDLMLGSIEDAIGFNRNLWDFDPGCYEMIVGFITKYDEWFYDTVNVYIDVDAELLYPTAH